jgi:hypothetical protein
VGDQRVRLPHGPALLLAVLLPPLERRPGRAAGLKEWQFWQQHGAEFAVLYQIHDGQADTALDRFGIRRVDGTRKPVAYVTPRLEVVA